MIPFSRLASTLQLPMNPLYRERDARRERGDSVIDLISGNVTEQGIAFPAVILKEILADAAGRTAVYRPHPLGQPAAREAVSSYYERQGVSIPPSQILLTPGTSLAYSYAFSILADPGDEVLTPSPSYPLFDEIARLSGVHLVPYRLDGSRSWSIDLADLSSKISSKTRAIVLISPHHPTGAVIGREDLKAIAALASRHRLPIVADEVFGEFLFDRETLPRPAATQAPLVITLNGFSKLFALPGIKLGWMALTGESDSVGSAMTALEAVSDTFLPVNEIVQAAVPEVFQRGASFLSAYRDEVNRRALGAIELLESAPGLTLIPPQGGFYGVIRIDDGAEMDDEALAIDILRYTGCLVHPGFFYDLEPTHLVMSLVSDPVVSGPAVERMVKYIAGRTQR